MILNPDEIRYDERMRKLETYASIAGWITVGFALGVWIYPLLAWIS